jgi:hypothetical protein
MSDIKLFQIGCDRVEEIPGQSVAVERSLQTLIEGHLEAFLGVRFLATEYVTGKMHAGRIDTLGIDKNDFPVVIEYKRAVNENVINQGLFYLNWLLDHRAEFELLVMHKLGKDVADSIKWSSPRLLCIAADFTKYDEQAVQQISGVELIRYRRHGENLLLLELVNATATTVKPPPREPNEPGRRYGAATAAGVLYGRLCDGEWHETAEVIKDVRECKDPAKRLTDVKRDGKRWSSWIVEQKGTKIRMVLAKPESSAPAAEPAMKDEEQKNAKASDLT